MAKHKMKRVGIAIDMTAMVDVAFLLLTFFLLTTKFKAEDNVPIELPSSSAVIKLPTSNVIMLSVEKSGTVHIQADNTRGARGLAGGDGAAIVRPQDLRQALVALRAANPSLRSVIKADKDVPYHVVQQVMTSLQEARITRFALITSLET